MTEPRASRPAVSVLMPVRNEGEFIARSLGAVLAQDYPAELLEVLVVDGMSEDGTREVVERLAASSAGVEVRLLDNPGRIAATALNVGVAAATGAILVRVDGHCEIAPDYVRRCVEHLLAGEEDGIEGVGGPIETVGQTPTAEVVAVAMSSPFGVGGSAFRTRQDRILGVDTVAFPAYPRRVVDRLGPFDEELVRNQDDEYNYRLRSRGGKLLLAPDVRSRYYSRSSLESTARQYFQYGLFKVRVLQKHPRQTSARQFAPAALVAALGAFFLGAPWSRLARRGLVATLLAYLAANAVATVGTGRDRGLAPRRWPLLAAAFATLHLAYGSGFLAGLVRWARRWGDRRGGP